MGEAKRKAKKSFGRGGGKELKGEEGKNHWRKREKRKREQKTQGGKIAASGESCHLLPALPLSRG